MAIISMNAPLPIRQATLKKKLFPVQRVAKIVASWAAAKSIFFLFFLLVRK